MIVNARRCFPICRSFRPEWIRRSIRWGGCLVLALALPLFGFSLTAAETQAVLQQAGNLLEWGRWKEARQLLTASLGQDPNNPRLLAYSAHVLVGFGDYVAALAQAKQAVDLDQQCALCHLYLSEALGERAKHMSRFRALLQLGKIKKQLELASTLNPNLPDVHWGWINFNLEVPAAAGGSTGNALQQAGRLALVDPVDGYIARAAIDLAANHNQQALQEYLEAARKYPNDPRGLFYAGLTYFQQRQYATAAPYLARAAKLQAQSSLYSAYYAAVLVFLQREAEARGVLQASLALHPDSRLGDYLVAQALKQTGRNFDWAKELLQHYLATAPEPDQPTRDDAARLLASLG